LELKVLEAWPQDVDRTRGLACARADTVAPKPDAFDAAAAAAAAAAAVGLRYLVHTIYSFEFLIHRTNMRRNRTPSNTNPTEHHSCESSFHQT
jgi:hypothetical protein